MPKKTKIIATLGPATDSPEMVERLYRAGTDIFRINTSHGESASIRRMIRHVRRVEKKLGTFIGILLDLQGPKIRIGRFKNGFIEIHRGDRLIFTTENIIGDENTVPIQYRNFHRDVKAGNRILLDDGNLSVKVVRVEGRRVHVEVQNGGTLSDHKGLNLPESSISVSAITPGDIESLSVGLNCGVDFVALSFVKDQRDIEKLRRLIRKEGGDAEIIAKIERHEAIGNIEGIIEKADGVMVARGDMGVEIPYEQVPLVQNDILTRANRMVKPAIVATQMLESMIQNYRATRAEVSDIANAVFSYADALMLSAETAVGAYPVEAVETMARTAEAIEKYQMEHHSILQLHSPEGEPPSVTHGITYAANQLGEVLGASAIIAFTETGRTARHLSMHRPAFPIYAFTPHVSVARRLTILRNVYPFTICRARDIKRPLRYIFGFLKEKGLLRKGERVILTSGIPMRVSGSTNMLRVETVR
jgi:pyruvate kinase